MPISHAVGHVELDTQRDGRLTIKMDCKELSIYEIHNSSFTNLELWYGVDLRMAMFGDPEPHRTPCGLLQLEHLLGRLIVSWELRDQRTSISVKAMGTSQLFEVSLAPNAKS
jgi:hypothetical protein